MLHFKVDIKRAVSPSSTWFSLYESKRDQELVSLAERIRSDLGIWLRPPIVGYPYRSEQMAYRAINLEMASVASRAHALTE